MSFEAYSPSKKLELTKAFRFGLESEYLVVRAQDFQPLWHQELYFEKLNEIFEQISLEGIPSCEGLDLEPPQKKLMPFVVEGYHLPDMDFHAKEILPKGVEIRTPVCNSLAEVLNVHSILYTRLKETMRSHGYDLVCLSHHPLHSAFSGPQNKRRHDYWQWSMEVMTTYGPDINVSFSEELAQLISHEDLEAKINFYGPALSALSVASPFVDGSLWKIGPEFGKSFRMHKRSYIAPPIEFHPTEKNRFEFKVFDMPSSIQEIEAQFLAFIALVLDESLKGRASKQTRIYDLGQVARKGLMAESVQERLSEFLEKAPGVLQEWGYNPQPLEIFKERLLTGRTPADDMIDLFKQTGSLIEVLKSRSPARMS